ncbi:MAG: FadR/GntR family transcriptional regulator [Anaerolineaceae bacterium]|jgi:GntR family transcriptional repressor for pyruvate dehydrogenase complex
MDIGSRITKINRNRYFEQAVEQMHNLLSTEEIGIGDRLPTEQQLSEKFDIGRSSIREALRVLETEGLIEVRHGSGTYVTAKPNQDTSQDEAIKWLKQHKESIVHLLQVRQWLEGLSVSLVAKDPSPEVIEELELLLNEMAQMYENHVEHDRANLDRIAALNTQFHLTISSHSGNEIAHEILSYVLPAFSESNKAVLDANPILNTQLDEHRAVLYAIKERQPDEASKLLMAHIGRVLHEVVTMS